MTNASQFTYSVLVDDKPVRIFAHNGKNYILANKGAEYSIKVRNDSSNRILASISVDSLNILNGQVNSEAGYIINGRSSNEFKGWRTDENTENCFRFNAKDRSYAAKSEETKGETNNAGVIGFKIFAEKIESDFFKEAIEELKKVREDKYHPYPVYPVWPPYDYPKYPWHTPYTPWVSWYSTTTRLGNDASSSCLRGMNLGNEIKAQNFSTSCSITPEDDYVETEVSPPNPFTMGTEFSNKKVESKIDYVSFKTGNLIETFEIYYTDRAGLLSLGVPIDKKVEVVFPQAFPKFCKPPKS